MPGLKQSECLECETPFMGSEQKRFCNRRCSKKNYMRGYYKEHEEEIRLRDSKYREKNRAIKNKKEKLRYENNKEEILVKDAIHYQKTKKQKLKGQKKYYHDKLKHDKEFQRRTKIRSKHKALVKLLPDDLRCCQVCNSRDNLENHHPDWNEPDLFVILCKKPHHFEEHGKTDRSDLNGIS